MKMLLGWGPTESQEKKEKKKRADLNIMCDNDQTVCALNCNIHNCRGTHMLQFSSVAQSCPTPCDPRNRSTPGLPVGEDNGNLLQCSCLENPRDGGACWAAIYGVSQSQTWLMQLSSSSNSSSKKDKVTHILCCRILPNFVSTPAFIS